MADYQASHGSKVASLSDLLEYPVSVLRQEDRGTRNEVMFEGNWELKMQLWGLTPGAYGYGLVCDPAERQ